MGVPLFDPATPLAGLRRRLGEAIDDVLDRGQFILGPEVAAFEEELAGYLGPDHAVGVANGTEALTIALRALGVGPGDDVVVPSFSFYASAEAVPPTGARPVFCDVDRETFFVTPETVSAALTPRTKAVIAVDLFGNVAPVRAIEALGLPVVEDAAQAAGSTGPTGAPGRSARWRRSPSTRRRTSAPSATAARSPPPTRRWPSACARCASTARATRSAYEEVGYNSRLDELQAAILRPAARTSTPGPTHRRGAARATREAGLGELVGCPARPRPRPPGTCSWSATSAPTSSPPRCGGRDRSRAYYRAPIHRQPAMAAVRAGRRAAGDRRGRARAPRPPDDPRRSPRPGRRGRRAPCAMRVWVDLTNSPHVLVMRPVIDALRARGAEVRVTARDFAQTVALCERFGIEHEVIGRHRGGRVAAKALGLAAALGRARALGAPRGPFDLALGHGSNDVTVAARLLRIPCSTMFDYEWATVQHTVNCRLAQAVVVPEAIPPERLDRYGARRQAAALPGAEGGVLPRRLRARSGGPRRARPRSRAAARRRAHAAGGLALPPLRERRSSPTSSTACAARRPSCCPRIAEQRAQLDGLHRPRARDRRAVAIAYADLVSARAGR